LGQRVTKRLPDSGNRKDGKVRFSSKFFLCFNHEQKNLTCQMSVAEFKKISRILLLPMQLKRNVNARELLTADAINSKDVKDAC